MYLSTHHTFELPLSYKPNKWAYNDKKVVNEAKVVTDTFVPDQLEKKKELDSQL